MTIDLDNFESLLDTHYSEIPSLPKFCSFPTGLYKLRTIDAKIVPPADGKDFRIDVVAELLEVVEVLEGADAIVPIPELNSRISFMYSGGKGVQRFSEVYQELLKGLNISTPRELIEQFATVEWFCQNKSRSYKDKVSGEIRHGNDVVNAVLA